MKWNQNLKYVLFSSFSLFLIFSNLIVNSFFIIINSKEQNKQLESRMRDIEGLIQEQRGSFSLFSCALFFEKWKKITTLILI